MWRKTKYNYITWVTKENDNGNLVVKNWITIVNLFSIVVLGTTESLIFLALVSVILSAPNFLLIIEICSCLVLVGLFLKLNSFTLFDIERRLLHMDYVEYSKNKKLNKTQKDLDRLLRKKYKKDVAVSEVINFSKVVENKNLLKLLINVNKDLVSQIIEYVNSDELKKLIYYKAILAEDKNFDLLKKDKEFASEYEVLNQLLRKIELKIYELMTEKNRLEKNKKNKLKKKRKKVLEVM